MTMSPDTFNAWSKSLGLSDQAVETISSVRSSDAAVRRVKRNKKSVIGFYPSNKMGVTIQFESHTVELSGIYLYEHDVEVLEYYDQPLSMKLRYLPARGRPVGPVYTPDFLVLASSGPILDEWKPEEKLRELASDSPNRYIFDGERWHCPPAQEAAKKLGLGYSLRSDSEINPYCLRNLRFLEDYLLAEPSPEGDLHELVRMIVASRPGITRYELHAEVQEPLVEVGDA